MNGPESCPTRAVALPAALGCFALFLAVAIGLQIVNGAYRAEFGNEPDEAAHYVTGLVIHEYVVQGCPGNPMRFAENYYEHYPKVAVGHWPPGFYLVQAVWSLIFTPQRESMLVLMAVLAASAAFSLFFLLKLDFGTAKSVGAALVFLCFPLVQRFSAAIMTEIPVSLLCLLATIFWMRYLQKERLLDAVIFGTIASAAILTKQSSVCLAIVPVFSVLVLGKSYFFRKFSFWVPAIVVLILTVPWNIATLSLLQEGMVDSTPNLSFTKQAIPFFVGKLLGNSGRTLSLLALLGVGFCLYSRVKRTPVAASMFGLLTGVLLVCVLIPAGNESRHLVPALAPAIFFVLAGADCITGVLQKKLPSMRFASVGVCSAALLMFMVEEFYLSQKGYSGFRAVAEVIAQNPDAKKLLISSDARGEGMFISEIAMREKRPCRIVRRASKDLAESSWSGDNYGLKIQDEEALLESVKTNAIDHLVVDASVPKNYLKPHHRLLKTALQHHPGLVILEKSFPIQREGVWIADGIQLYRVTQVGERACRQ